MELKDPKETKKHVKAILEALNYFDEVVLCVTGDKMFKFYSLNPARGDDRLYIHGIEEVLPDE